jgi:ribonuclease J
MLVKHAEIAQQCGVPAENTFIMQNGDVFALTKTSAKMDEKVPAGIVLIDSHRAWEIDETILAQRREIVKDGAITIAVTINADCSKLLSFDYTQKGIILADSAESIGNTIEKEIKKLLAKYNSDSRDKNDPCQSFILREIKQFLEQEYEIQPLVQIILHQMHSSDSKAKENSSQSYSTKN